jgi:hypothetical protein
VGLRKPSKSLWKPTICPVTSNFEYYRPKVIIEDVVIGVVKENGVG